MPDRLPDDEVHRLECEENQFPPVTGGRVSIIEKKLEALGLTLPAEMVLPPGVVLPFPWVRVHGKRALISGHAAQNADGSLAGPLGKVGLDVSVEEARANARRVGLAILGSLKRELGDLDRVSAWLRVFGMVNSAPGFNQQPAVINGFSDLILEIYGPLRGSHARSAVGMAELPFRIPVEIEAEVEIDT
jgi:YjgF/chorismate_mutase-like, putative endoribonuclease